MFVEDDATTRLHQEDVADCLIMDQCRKVLDEDQMSDDETDSEIDDECTEVFKVDEEVRPLTQQERDRDEGIAVSNLMDRKMCTADEHREEVFLTGARGEVSMWQLNDWQKGMFRQADEKEWNSIVSNEVVRVCSDEEAKRVWSETPERVMKSRSVRTWKDLEVPAKVLCNDGKTRMMDCKAKSRWVVQGLSDPDALELKRSSPVASTRSIMFAQQLKVCKNWRTTIGDVKTAYLKQDKRERVQGKIFVMAHINGRPQMCELLKDSYGCVNGSVGWYDHFRCTLLSNKRIKACRFCESTYKILSEDGGSVEGIICVVVDDMMMVYAEKAEDVVSWLSKQFEYGKWEDGSGRFCGRQIDEEPGCALIHRRHKIEKIEPLKIPNDAQDEDELSAHELTGFRSAIGQALYAARETNPLMSFDVSGQAQRVPHVHQSDCKDFNRRLKKSGRAVLKRRE